MPGTTHANIGSTLFSKSLESDDALEVVDADAKMGAILMD